MKFSGWFTKTASNMETVHSFETHVVTNWHGVIAEKEFYNMPCHGNERVFGSLLIKRNVLLLQFWSSVLVDTGLQCPLSRMVAHVVKKFLTSVRVLSTICFQILVHMDPIYSILKWKQRVPPELPYHTTALHGVQTQKPTM